VLASQLESLLQLSEDGAFFARTLGVLSKTETVAANVKTVKANRSMRSAFISNTPFIRVIFIL
jgi:hypothetical protein